MPSLQQSSTQAPASTSGESSPVAAQAEQVSTETSPEAAPAVPKEPLLVVESLTKSYRDAAAFFSKATSVLQGVSFCLYRGEILAITGENASGKSTIANIISGLIPADSGSVRFNGVELTFGDASFRREHIRLAKISLVDTFILDVDVNEFLEMTLAMAQIVPEFRGELIVDTLKKIKAPPGLGQKSLKRLNKQEQALVTIAHAIILHPEIIIVDDIFATVDLSFKGVLINILLELQQAGFTILMVTADLGIVKHMSDRVIILGDGVVEEIGDTYQVLNNSENKFTRRLVSSYFGRNLKAADWNFSL